MHDRSDSDASQTHGIPRTQDQPTGWDLFWFQATDVRGIARLRGALCFVTATYFLSSLSDLEMWYGNEGLLSLDQVANSLVDDQLAMDARFRLSPLFIVDNVWCYRAWLLIGALLCVLVAIGRGGRWAIAATWFAVIGWANRSLWLAGIAEPLLSMSWMAATIAPPASFWTTSNTADWTAGFARRLLATQATVVALATFVTMLAGRVWWNGTGAYALVAPAEDRYVDFSQWLAPSAFHEPLTHLLVWALPVGVVLAWRTQTRVVGRITLVLWCLAIALLTSHFLFAATLAIMLMAITPPKLNES